MQPGSHPWPARPWWEGLVQRTRLKTSYQNSTATFGKWFHLKQLNFRV